MRNMIGCLLILTFASIGHAQEPEVDCKNPQSNYDMRVCEGQRLERATKRLQRVYGAIVKALQKNSNEDSKEVLRRLQDSQNKWNAYAESNADLHATIMLGGTGEGLMYTGAKVEMTRQRTMELLKLDLDDF